MGNIEISIEVKTKNTDLFNRFQVLCNELDISADEALEIAVDRFLNDFNEIIHLWTSRNSINKRKYVKPEPGNIF